VTGESREQATTFVVPSDEGADGRLSPGSDPGEDGYGAPLSAPVKLVVWDLDETLWAGTLSEGPVALDPSTGDLVRTLNDRGIVNSICSKNDPEDARAELRRLGLWEEFVFARIDWSPKGARVAQIIDDAQLRPENVLFIDDSPTNRGEVRHFSEGIQTAGPEIIDHLLSLPELAGKDDRGRTRVRQYQVLERKLVDRQAASGSNEEFLRSCDIRVAVVEDTVAESERLHELLIRTHQLNFTKRWLDEDEFRAMVADPTYRTGYVMVRDRYGDYGICGFFSVDQRDGTLTDFLFSCRVLHMGVEQWLYDRLGRPPLSIVGEVASGLDHPVDWITEDDELPDPARPARPGPAGRVGAAPDDQRILMVGGCDLNTTAQFLGGRIRTEFAHTGPTGSFIHVGHTETLRQSAAGLTDGQRAVVDRIPFLDQSVYRSSVVVSPDYDVLVYRVLTDYTQGLYRHRDTNLIVPWLQFDFDITDPDRWGPVETRLGREGINREFLRWFTDEFEFRGGIPPDRFEENIRWLATQVPEGSRIVFVNGAEVALSNPSEPDRHLHHMTMNAILDRVVDELPNASVCDVRTFVTSPDDFTDSIRHYRRHSYLRMAEEIRGAGPAGLEVVHERWASRAFSECYKFAGRRRVQIRRLSKRLRGQPVGLPTVRR
jgi:FkbH-like protein